MTSLNFLFLLWHVTFKPLLHISYTSPFTQKILLQQTFEIIEIAFSVLSRFDKLNRNHYLSSKKCFFGERSYSANSVGKRKEQEQWEDLCWRVIQNYLEPFIWWIDSCPCLKACVGYSRSWLEFFYYFLDIRSNQQSPVGRRVLSVDIFIPMWTCKSRDIKYKQERDVPCTLFGIWEYAYWQEL